MKILYLSESYLFSDVHHNLCNSLSKNDTVEKITVFSIQRPDIKIKNKVNQYNSRKYETIIIPHNGSALKYKYDFKFKISLKYKLLVTNININTYDVVIASTLFNEGALAYKLYKKHNIPYVTLVRGTDSNFYMKKMPHLWLLGNRIMKNAKAICFLSQSIMNKTQKSVPFFATHEDFKFKFKIIPNGVDDIYINNAYYNRNKNPRNILFIGRFDQNKNIQNLIKAFLRLKKQHPTISLNLIGGGGKFTGVVNAYCQKIENSIRYIGPIYEKKELIKEFRKNDIFVMPSHSETFGLVYIEALSQGLPLLYTKNQGIDGLLGEEIGESVNSHSIKSIYNGLRKILINYNSYEYATTSLHKFSWENISYQYLNILKKSL